MRPIIIAKTNTTAETIRAIIHGFNELVLRIAGLWERGGRSYILKVNRIGAKEIGR